MSKTEEYYTDADNKSRSQSLYSTKYTDGRQSLNTISSTAVGKTSLGSTFCPEGTKLVMIPTGSERSKKSDYTSSSSSSDGSIQYFRPPMSHLLGEYREQQRLDIVNAQTEKDEMSKNDTKNFVQPVENGTFYFTK